jgi:2-polyprenyl-6-methoxyphenol hydroxylase-like FAD-dependent oxidoreductase
MSRIRRVLVIGGGVGGLTAAASLAMRGVAVTLIERRPAFDIPGVGLGQPANALRVYRALGVLEEILASGYIYDHMSLFDPARNLLVEHKFLLGDARIPPVCALPRSRLHDILLGATLRAGVEVQLGRTVVAFEDANDSVAVRFSNGDSDRFDLAAGFDGIRSSTREFVAGTAFLPRPSGYGAWRLQVPRPAYVTGMEFLQGIGGKAGAMPLGDELMYLFHIRPESPDAQFDPAQYPDLLSERLAQYGSYVADVRAALSAESDIVYSPIEPMLLPWPWFRGRVVLGGDAAHTFPPHLTQGAAMAAEDGYVLAHEILNEDLPVQARLMRYSQRRYARCAFVYAFSRDWMEEEQSVRTAAQLQAAREEMALNAAARIAASDRILNSPILQDKDTSA